MALVEMRQMSRFRSQSCHLRFPSRDVFRVSTRRRYLASNDERRDVRRTLCVSNIIIHYLFGFVHRKAFDSDARKSESVVGTFGGRTAAYFFQETDVCVT